MATSLNPKTNTGTTSNSLEAADYARAILAPLASLKLTVFLLLLATAVTFIATLQQTRADVFNVKDMHLASHFVAIPFQTFFVPAWLPNLQNVPGHFYIPSGRTVLFLMLINLAAAHVLRFKLQASGVKLIAGLAIGIVAGLVTWAIIFNGQNAQGFQANPPISYTQMWTVMQIGLLGLGIGALVGFFTLDKSRMAERILVGTGALICALVLGTTIYLGSEGFIGEPAMRILWQLAQSTFAALIAYVSCILLFKRKAGIVLLHLGVAGLMVNEIYVSYTNDEHRMTIIEGDTVSHVVDVRATEMAIVDISDPEFDKIVTVPGHQLVKKEKISDDKLPFDIKCVQYFPNSDIRRPSMDNPADTGLGETFQAFEVRGTAGTDSDQTVDFASAYVSLESKSGEPLGTHLISQLVNDNKCDSVTVDGKTYRIMLRFETEYKQYSMTLKDAKVEYYIGTTKPKFFSSDVVLNDRRNDVTSEQKIWMNNPLRYSEETFYQSGMNETQDGRGMTILQVVKNKGWMIPYVCCMFTVVGLAAQFGSTLLGFLEKGRRREEQLRQSGSRQSVAKEAVAELLAKDEASNRKFSFANTWWLAILFIGIFGIWTLGEMRKGTGKVVNKQGMRLDLLGQIPVTINGRVQPLDSFARNTARQLNKREFVFGVDEKRKPAIQWLADTVFEAEGYKDYRIFRIEDLNVLNALDLPPIFAGKRGKFRYTLGELLEAEPELRKLLPKSSDNDVVSSPFENRISAVGQMMQRVFGAKLAFGSRLPDDADVLTRLEEASDGFSSPLIPLVIPNDDKAKPWLSYNSGRNKSWIIEQAKKYNSASTDELTTALIEKEIIPPLRATTIRERVIQRLLEDPNVFKMVSEQNDETNLEVLARAMDANWDKMPGDIKANLMAAEAPIVDALLAQQAPRYTGLIKEQVEAAYGEAGNIAQEVSESTALLLALKPAFLAGDAEKFNSTLETYLASVKSAPPIGAAPGKLSAERFYNGFSPFYVAMVIYLVAFVVSTFGWMFWPKSWNRAATCLLALGLFAHLIGLILRIYISGRPPVTNLYSSALFVSAALVIKMLVVERFTKIGVGNAVASLGAFLALLWAWTMSIVDGDTFTVMVAVLDTQFWLATHVVIISIGYAATFGAGMLGLAFLGSSMFSRGMSDRDSRRQLGNVIYGVVCFGLICSFFGTVLGGLWGDDSWGRFWGWDPKENGALMIVLWNAVILHARWGGMIRERGLAILALLGNVVVLWSWKGVNAMGVGLHAYAASEDTTVTTMLYIGIAHVVLAMVAASIPTKFWRSDLAS